jgi:hypothetical protein
MMWVKWGRCWVYRWGFWTVAQMAAQMAAQMVDLMETKGMLKAGPMAHWWGLQKAQLKDRRMV